MRRLDAFQLLSEHAWYGKLYNKLSAAERVMCREFIFSRETLNADEFELAVNRWFVDKPKPKNWATMMELVSSSKPKGVL